MAERLAGKVALITGAASGLGKAMGDMFVAEGAKVVFTDINEEGVKAAAAPHGSSALALRHDVTKEADWEAAIEDAAEAFGGLHILVNNAGIGIGTNIVDTDWATWRKVHEVDLDSVFWGCKLAIPEIVDTVKADGGRGSILNISSIAGVIAAHNMAAYNSAKAAVRHLSKSVALYCAKEGHPITCNSLHPVFIDTPILNDIAPGAPRETLLTKLGRQIPLGRVGEPNDVAYAAVYLCSDEAKFVTGSELYVDGGISAM
jgi:NAD(P)-dependent dehydrogenase (short-subunit alcohol dehydrogenase family)